MVVGGRLIGPGEAVDLAKSLGYDVNNYDYIRLLMCHSADGGNASFAQTLSNITRKPVKGFIGKVAATWAPEEITEEIGKFTSRQEALATFIGKKYEITDPAHKKIVGFNDETGGRTYANTDAYNSVRINFFPL